MARVFRVRGNLSGGRLDGRHGTIDSFNESFPRKCTTTCPSYRSAILISRNYTFRLIAGGAELFSITDVVGCTRA